MSTVTKDSSRTALECALRCDGSAKQQLNFKSAVIRSNRSCFRKMLMSSFLLSIKANFCKSLTHFGTLISDEHFGQVSLKSG